METVRFSTKPVAVDPILTKYRKIATSLPVPDSIPLLERMYSLESRSMHGQLPIIWDRADNFQVYDSYGNVWIDFTSTIFVANSGHGNKRIRNALKTLIDKPLLHTYTYASRERIEYLDYLISNTPAEFEKAFLLSAGTEATEAAFKLMRLSGKKNNKRRGGIVCFDGAYHGRTMAAQMMTGNHSARDWMGYQDPNIHHLPYPYPWVKDCDSPELYFEESIKALLNEKELDSDQDICGFMLETYQGWGAIFFPNEYITALFKYARKHNIIVTFDEMQAGFGRTGPLFGYMHYGVTPDLICLGKGASSGFPLSVVLGSSEIMDLPEIGSMSSTHSANPLACIAGHENLKALLEDGIIERGQKLGELMHRKLMNIQQRFHSKLRYVFGKGLLAALVFIDRDENPLSALCNRISEMAMQRGLLVICTGRESIKLAPPLTISEEALNEGIDVLESCIADCLRQN
jgi:4-aminobutyrate aminotransferase / (S)-3-amino-2-methylpropionate transaminase / 5-aminovalerate transaminase